jgi:hypothetical protein
MSDLIEAMAERMLNVPGYSDELNKADMEALMAEKD